ncbi:ABC transporter ATP-binding protein [Phenylobacterium sp.]|uniref:ABC transporter ATP-binding protein n=1 Tax=Phenylobacterium sp. TaxID=1871053 RepID=UPI0035B2DD4A
MAALLEVEGLRVAYAGAAVVEDLSLQVAAGEVVGIVGESGSGKSTAALAVLGLLPASARVEVGRLALNGEPLGRLTPRERRRRLGRGIAYVPQEPLTAFNPTLRIGRQLDLALGHRWREPAGARRARAASWLSRMGLAEPERVLRAYPFELSGGQLQRVLLAQAFSLEPRLVVADEPTTALDVTVQADILDLFERLARETGVGLLFISHDVGVIWRLCDRVVVMRQGRMVEAGATSAVLSTPSQPYTRRLLAALPSRSPPRTRLPLGEPS